MLLKSCPTLKCFHQNIEVFISKFPSCYKPQFYSQQIYRPLVWYFCGQTNNAKLEKTQEWSLRIFCNTSSYEDLLVGLSTLLLNFQIHINTECLRDIFKTHVVPYDLRTTNMVQPARQSTTCGLRSFLELDYGMNSLKIILSYVKLIALIWKNL